MLRRISGWEKDQMTVPRIFLRNVMKTPNKTAFMMDDHRMTFQQVNLFYSDGKNKSPLRSILRYLIVFVGGEL